MGTGNARVAIDRPAEEVWTVVGDFGGIGEWMPGIDSCRVEGDDRIIETMGMTITEHLVKKDDTARALTYSIVEGAPVERHEAVVTVTPDGAGSVVTWDVDAEPDDMAGLMGTVYQGALDALKVHVEG